MKVRKTVWNGKEGYLLQNESMEVFVNPADGMNIYQIDWEGRHLSLIHISEPTRP